MCIDRLAVSHNVSFNVPSFAHTIFSSFAHICTCTCRYIDIFTDDLVSCQRAVLQCGHFVILKFLLKMPKQMCIFKKVQRVIIVWHAKSFRLLMLMAGRDRSDDKGSGIVQLSL